MITTQPPAWHYRDPKRKSPPLTPWEDGWLFHRAMFHSEAEMLKSTWGHLPAKWQEYYRDLYDRHKAGLKPRMPDALVEQFAEMMLENWEIFAPVILEIMQRLDQAKEQLP